VIESCGGGITSPPITSKESKLGRPLLDVDDVLLALSTAVFLIFGFYLRQGYGGHVPWRGCIDSKKYMAHG